MSSLPVDFENEIRNMFLQEASDSLEELESQTLDLETSANPEIVEKIFRVMHTIKGSASGVGFKGLANLAHHAESLLVALRVGKRTNDALFMKAFFAALDHMNQYVAGLKASFDFSIDCTEVIALIAQAEHGEANLQTVVAILESAKDGDIIFDTQALNDFHRNETKANVAESPSDPQKKDGSETLSVGKESKTLTKGTASTKEDSVRVSAQKIDELMNLIGELVILQNMMLQNRHEVASKEMQVTFTQLNKLGNELQSLAMRLRLVPLQGTFQRMRKIARDAGNSVGKTIEFKTEGDSTELDRLVLEKLFDPLVHLIRNAVDHGIEENDERVAAGKSVQGSVTLSARYKGDKVLIKVIDDGKGIDPQKILASALKKGLVKGDPARFSNDECLEFLFMSGFSTREQVTSLSGRGVGMDVVRTSVRALGGEIKIESVVGKGSQFLVELPLTLAIIDGITVLCGKERFVIPASHVAHCVRPLEGDIKTVCGDGRVLKVREMTLPLLKMFDLIEMADSLKMGNLAMLIRGDEDEVSFAIEVDEILGRTQVVTKPLGRELTTVKGVSGAAILGDGKTALILDLPKQQKAQRASA
jgi:two-component system, chemotaxis family, sensor kinase CheA